MISLLTLVLVLSTYFIRIYFIFVNLCLPGNSGTLKDFLTKVLIRQKEHSETNKIIEYSFEESSNEFVKKNLLGLVKNESEVLK